MTTADYLLEALNECGIDCLFSNLGTDHAPIVEALAQWDAADKKHPRVILCPHETVAVSMSTAFAQCTGRGQAVLVHTEVGTANAAMGIINAMRTRAPLLLMAGKTPFAIHGELPGGRNNPVHFLQDTFDQGGIVRPYVKWEYTLPSGVIVKEAVRRAHSVMHSEPKGPVYLMLPREILAEQWEPSSIHSFPAEQYGPVAASGVEDAALQKVAERLLEADNPILITTYAGRNAHCPVVLDRLARLAGIKVFEAAPTALNIPRDSPCFCGFSAEKELASADFGLLVDVDVPWIPARVAPKANSFWVHADVDVLKQDIPMWGFPSQVRMQGDSAKVLGRLAEIVKQREQTSRQREAIERRLASVANCRKRFTDEREQEFQGQPPSSEIHPALLCSELNKVIGRKDIVVHETVRNAPAVLRHIERTEPGTLITCGGSGLGYGGGAALGVKLANPDQAVFHLTGDGSFYFSSPSAVYAVSRRYSLPIFTVVFENGGWAAVKDSTQMMYPQGASTAANDFQSLLAPLAFEKIGEAAGAHGESVSDSKALPGAIQRCLEAVHAGRSAILVAHLDDRFRCGPASQPDVNR